MVRNGPKWSEMVQNVLCYARRSSGPLRQAIIWLSKCSQAVTFLILLLYGPEWTYFRLENEQQKEKEKETEKEREKEKENKRLSHDGSVLVGTSEFAGQNAFEQNGNFGKQEVLDLLKIGATMVLTRPRFLSGSTITPPSGHQGTGTSSNGSAGSLKGA